MSATFEQSITDAHSIKRYVKAHNPYRNYIVSYKNVLIKNFKKDCRKRNLVIKKGNLLPGATLCKPIPQFKKTKSNRNMLGRSSSRSKGGSKNLLLCVSKSKLKIEQRTKSQNCRDDQIVEATTDDTNEDDNNLKPTLLKPPTKPEEKKEKPSMPNLFVSAFDDNTSDCSKISNPGSPTEDKIDLLKKHSKISKCSSEVQDSPNIRMNMISKIELSSLEDTEGQVNSVAMEMTPKEKQILQKELSSEEVKYEIPERQLASLEMQEALLAERLCGMYEKLMNLEKSSFYRLSQQEPNYSDISEDSD